MGFARILVGTGLVAAAALVAGALRPDLPVVGGLARLLRPADPLDRGASGPDGERDGAWSEVLGDVLPSSRSDGEGPPGPAVLYRFVDDGGVLRIVDSIEQVPEKHRAGARRLETSPDTPAFENTYAVPKRKPKRKPKLDPMMLPGSLAEE